MYAVVLPALLALSAAEPDLAGGVLKELNARRKAAGLEAVTLDDKLSAACLAHARYLLKNFDPQKGGSFNPHKEDPDKPGYTKEGDQAARQSEISFLIGDDQAVQHSLDALFACFFHRIGLIHPNLRRIGLGYAVNGRTCVVVLNDRAGRVRGWPKGGKPVLYPPADGKDVPLRFAGNEQPNPIPPEGKGKQQGFPVTITFPSGVRVTDASVQLTAGGKEIAAWTSSPQKPAYRPEFQHNTVCLIPQSPLQARTTYQVRASATVQGKPWLRTWSFTTGD